jgi:hypothetical protein
MLCNLKPPQRSPWWLLLLMMAVSIATSLLTSCASFGSQPVPVVVDLPTLPPPPLPTLEPRPLPPFQGRTWRHLLIYVHQLREMALASETDKKAALTQLRSNEDVQP